MFIGTFCLLLIMVTWSIINFLQKLSNVWQTRTKNFIFNFTTFSPIFHPNYRLSWSVSMLQTEKEKRLVMRLPNSTRKRKTEKNVNIRFFWVNPFFFKSYRKQIGGEHKVNLNFVSPWRRKLKNEIESPLSAFYSLKKNENKTWISFSYAITVNRGDSKIGWH